MTSLGNNVFEIVFPNLAVGKIEFDLPFDAGTYIFDKEFFLGAGNLEYNLFLFGGVSNVPYNIVVYNPSFSLTNITNIISTNSNYIGTVGSQFSFISNTEIKFVLYVNDSTKKVYEDSKLILVFKKIS